MSLCLAFHWLGGHEVLFLSWQLCILLFLLGLEFEILIGHVPFN